MKATRVIRLNCDFCRRRGFQRPRMERHEAGCTRNTNRVCGMCRTTKTLTQQPLAFLVLALDRGGLDELRALSGGCPACMLSAIHVVRARPGVTDDPDHPENVLYTTLDDFKWKDECARFWGCFELIGPEGGETAYYGPVNVAEVSRG